VEVDVEDLVKTGEEIEKKFKETLNQLQKGQQDYRQIHQELSMYR